MRTTLWSDQDLSPVGVQRQDRWQGSLTASSGLTAPRSLQSLAELGVGGFPRPVVGSPHGIEWRLPKAEAALVPPEAEPFQSSRLISFVHALILLIFIIVIAHREAAALLVCQPLSAGLLTFLLLEGVLLIFALLLVGNRHPATRLA